MTVGKLIELLQELPKDDLIQVQHRPGRSNFECIFAVHDDINIGVWNIQTRDFEDGEDVWSDAKARGEIDEPVLITEDFLKINNFYKPEPDCPDSSDLVYVWSNDECYISVAFTDYDDIFDVLYESYDITDGGIIKYVSELKSIFQRMGIPIQWKEVH
jgi:hypothetical protein